MTGRLSGGRLELPDGAAIALAKRYAREGEATLAVRPTACAWCHLARGCVEGEVELCTWLGAVVEHAVRIAPNPPCWRAGRDLALMRRLVTLQARAWRCAGRRRTNGCSIGGPRGAGDIRETSHA